MWKFFSTLTPAGRWLLLGGVIAVLVVVAVVFKLLDDVQDTAEEVGRLETTTQVQEKVIEDVDAANKAVEARASATADDRRADCLRWSRTPENC